MSLAQVSQKADNNELRLDNLKQIIELPTRVLDGTEYLVCQLSDGTEYKFLKSEFATSLFIKIEEDRILSTSEQTRIIHAKRVTGDITVTIPDDLGWVNGRQLTVIVDGSGFSISSGSNVTINQPQAFQNVDFSVYEVTKMDNNLFSVVQIGTSIIGGGSDDQNASEVPTDNSNNSFTGTDVQETLTESATRLDTLESAMGESLSATILFDTPLEHGSPNSLTSSELILDLTGAKAGTTRIVHINRESEPSYKTTSDTNFPFFFKSGQFVANEDNILWFTYTNRGVVANIQNDSRPSLEQSVVAKRWESSTSNQFTMTSISNATTYEILFSTTNDISTASSVPSYNGIDLTYTHTGLTTGTRYYYWFRPVADGYKDTDYVSFVMIPQTAISQYYNNDFTGTVIDDTKINVNGDQSDVEVSQDDILILKDITTEASGITVTEIETDTLFNRDTSSGDTVVLIDLNRDQKDSGSAVLSKFQMMLTDAQTPTYQINIRTNDSNANDADLRIKYSTGSVDTTTSLGIKLQGLIRFSKSGTTLDVERYNASTNVWDQAYTGTFTDDFIGYLRLTRTTSTVLNQETQINKMFVGSAKWFGEEPPVNS